MKPSETRELERLLKEFFQETGVRRAIVFGSSSRSTETRKSDIDLLVVMDTSKRFFDRCEDLEGIYDLVPGRAVDLLIYTPDELSRIAHRPFIKRILAEGQTIYEH